MKKNFAAVLSLFLALLGLGLNPAGAMDLSLNDSGIQIDNGDSKFAMAFPFLVDAAKKDIPLQDKTVSGKTAVLKFVGGGQIDIELGDGQIIFKLSQLPEGAGSLSLGMKVGMEFATGGKWKVGEKESPFPAAKGPQNIYQGSARGLLFTTASGTKTSFVVPDHSFQQLQDGREWSLNYFAWKTWIPILPGVARYVIDVRNRDLALWPVVATPPPPSSVPSAPIPPAKPGDNPADTIVLKWKDGKQAVFMLSFDDSCPTDIKNVIPELTKRKMVGTFFIVTGGPVHTNEKAGWEKATANPYVVLGNHTFHHTGVQNAEELDSEISKCNDSINAYYPNRKTPRLISFGTPGGVPWKVTKEEFKAALDKYHLINRPNFDGPPFHQKSAAEMIATVEETLKRGDMGHMDFHGVGGDWHVTPLDWFNALLDKLEESRPQLWITDPISWHQYVTERKTAAIKVVKSAPDEIRLTLVSEADPALYDLPLSLATRVPADWKDCTVAQGSTQTAVAVVDGIVRYNALPGPDEIILCPSTAR